MALNLSGTSGAAASTTSALLEQLSSRPSPALVYYHADTGERVELSGAVLANWAVKLMGLFREEYDVADAPTGLCLVDMVPHWKAAAIVLATQALGYDTVLTETEQPVDLVLTDRPSVWLHPPSYGDAELAAVSHGLLDSSFETATGESLPAWVLDVTAEVRQQPDQLVSPAEELPLPPASASTGSPLVVTYWESDTAALMLNQWAQGLVVILFEGEPAGPVWEQMLANEQLG